MTDDRPNILVFMTDQQRGDTVLPHHPAKMPNIDAFREEGVTFSHAFCPAPHCCPSRATFFTGLYPSEHGVWNNVAVANTLSRGLNDGVRLWTEDLAAAGYDLHWAGKWHVSYDEGPADRGFRVHSLSAGPEDREQASPMDRTWEAYRRLAAQANADQGARSRGEIVRPGYGSYTHYGVRENPFGDGDHVDAAIEALKQAGQRGAPWMMYVGPLGPHDPYFVPQRFLDMYDPDSIELPASINDSMDDKPNLYRRTRGVFDQFTPREQKEALLHYYAFCTYEDYLFGRVLETVEATGQSENTVVLFCSDHGDYAGEHGLWCKGLPCFRGAYHVPAIIRWPGVTAQAGSVVDELVSLADFGPTFLEGAGIPVDRAFSGRSLMPFLRGERPAEWRSEVYTQSNGNELYGIQRSVFSKDWKLVYNGFDFDELYDLNADPQEVRNEIDNPAHADRVRALYRLLWQFAAEHGDTCINPYIMVALARFGPAEAFR